MNMYHIKKVLTSKSTWKSKVIYTLFFLILSNYVYADCFVPPDTTIKTTVLSCRSVNPIKEIKNLNSLSNKNEIIKEYNGYELKTKSGKIFLSSYLKLTCEDINKDKESIITLSFSCCDGNTNAPCLLGYSEVLLKYEK